MLTTVTIMKKIDNSNQFDNTWTSLDFKGQRVGTENSKIMIEDMGFNQK